MLQKNETAPSAVGGFEMAATQPVRLRGIGTAVPPHMLPQDLARGMAERIFGSRYKDFSRLSRTFETSGVERRYSVCPPDWFFEDRGWVERTEAYLSGASKLFAEAARKALASAGMDAAEIDCIVTVSSTGLATPTLEARVHEELGFRSNVKRVPVFGLGCAGGVSGLSLASRLAIAEPGANVLLVCVETCTLSFRADRLQKADIIAAVLFGDGAAAAIVSAGEGAGGAIGTGGEHTWPGTLDIMGWTVDPTGLGVVFDRSIPAFVKANLRDAAEGLLAEMAIDPGEVDRYVCHPGGAKVVEAIEAAMSLVDGSLDVERSILRDFGNMSAPTVLFVLERYLGGKPKGTIMLTALGPGFTLSALPIRLDA